MTERLQAALDTHSRLIDLGPLLCNLVEKVNPQYRDQALGGLTEFVIALSGGELTHDDLQPVEAVPELENVVDPTVTARLESQVTHAATPEDPVTQTESYEARPAEVIVQQPEPEQTRPIVETLVRIDPVVPERTVTLPVVESSLADSWPIAARIPGAYDELKSIDSTAYTTLQRMLGRETGDVDAESKEAVRNLLTTLVFNYPPTTIETSDSDALPPVALRALYDFIGHNVPQGAKAKDIEVIDRLLSKKLSKAGITAADGIEMILVRFMEQPSLKEVLSVDMVVANQNDTSSAEVANPEPAQVKEESPHVIKLRELLSDMGELTNDEISFLLAHTDKHTEKIEKNTHAKSAFLKIKKIVDTVRGRYALHDEAKLAPGHLGIIRALVGSPVDGLPPKPGAAVAAGIATLKNPRDIRAKFGTTELPNYETLVLQSFEALGKAARRSHKYHNIRVS